MIERPFLGDLERQVMGLLWSSEPLDAKGVHAVVGERRGISPNTVQSTLERLFRKELLAREKVGHAYVYQRRLKRQGNFYVLEFDKILPKETGLLSHHLGGGLTFD